MTAPAPGPRACQDRRETHQHQGDPRDTGSTRTADRCSQVVARTRTDHPTSALITKAVSLYACAGTADRGAAIGPRRRRIRRAGQGRTSERRDPPREQQRHTGPITSIALVESECRRKSPGSIGVPGKLSPRTTTGEPGTRFSARQLEMNIIARGIPGSQRGGGAALPRPAPDATRAPCETVSTRRWDEQKNGSYPAWNAEDAKHEPEAYAPNPKNAACPRERK